MSKCDITPLQEIMHDRFTKGHYTDAMFIRSSNDLDSFAADCLCTDLGNVPSLTILDLRS